MFFDRQLASIFEENVENEALAKDLAIYAELTTEELQRRVIQMLTLIQPLFFHLLACFVVFIYITLLWPKFQLIQTKCRRRDMFTKNQRFPLIETLIDILIFFVLVILIVPHLTG